MATVIAHENRCGVGYKYKGTNSEHGPPCYLGLRDLLGVGFWITWGGTRIAIRNWPPIIIILFLQNWTIRNDMFVFFAISTTLHLLFLFFFRFRVIRGNGTRRNRRFLRIIRMWVIFRKRGLRVRVIRFKAMSFRKTRNRISLSCSK